MAFFWVTFTDRSPGCVEGDGPPPSIPSPDRHGKDAARHLTPSQEDALRRAQKFGQVHSWSVIPYPAEPRLDVRSECPSFCNSPRECSQHTCCPKRYACSE